MKDRFNNIPFIRFNNFNDEWEQCKFIDILNKKDGIRRGPFGSSLKKELFVDESDYVVYEQQNAIYNRWDTRYNITEQKFNELHNFVLKENDFILSGAGTIGRIAMVPSGIKQGVFNQALIRIRINNDKVDPSYFLEWIRSDKMQKKLTGANPGSAITNLVPMSELKEWNIIVPSYNEQQKIGSFFKSLDHLITLHQSKLENLEKTKKGLLQKMFPKNSEVIPNIRFNSFTDDWEQCKLGSLSTIVRGASPRPIQDPKWFDQNSDVGWLRISDVTEQNGRIHYLEQHISKLGQEKTRVLNDQHLLLSIAATVGKPVMNYIKTGVHDGFLIFLEPKFNIEYMFQWLEMFRTQWQKYGQPGSQVNLNSELVKEQKIFIPKEKEQEKIAALFLSLDHLITLHQRKLQNLEEIKKGLLQQMFL